MNIFVAGATGVIGTALMPRLQQAGHQITALTRNAQRAKQLDALGITPVIGDVFAREQLMDLVGNAKPDIVIHQLTSIPERMNPKRILNSLGPTNRLRTEGTQNLMAAAKSAGTHTFLAQSIGTYYTPNSPIPATEEDLLYTDAPASYREIIDALVQLEQTTLATPGINGIVMRYGYFYGPGTIYAPDGTFTEDVRKRKIPIIGKGTGIFSFIHVNDAADATVLALQAGEPGIYNIVDDEPAPLCEWLPTFAHLADAPIPQRVPKWIGRLAAGPFGLFYMTEQRGASNQKAKKKLGWQPSYRSWREGFSALLGKV